MRTVKFAPFPFEILAKYSSVEHTIRKGISSSRVWAVVKHGNEICYAPPHVSEKVNYYIVTAEQHDCGTYYLDEEKDDDQTN